MNGISNNALSEVDNFTPGEATAYYLPNSLRP